MIGLINAPASPLASVCSHVVEAGAAPEVSVAATKSVVLSWLAGLDVIAEAAGASREDWSTLADRVETSLSFDWSDAAAMLDAPALVVLGRGSAYGAAREIALKLKELAGLPAEAISAAEVMHGPRAMIGPSSAVLALATDAAPLHAPLQALRTATSRIVIAGPAALALQGVGDAVSIGKDLSPALAPIATVAALYPLCVALARRRGRDPDAPRALSKVTLTH